MHGTCSKHRDMLGTIPVLTISSRFYGLIHILFPFVLTSVSLIYHVQQSALTAYQCLALANGLFQRWKIYYPLFPTLIRLLALQAICWPATHLTLRILGGRQRPLICWIVIGTTTCVSRSIQIWVTSNLGGDAKAKGKTKDDEGRRTREWISMGSGLGLGVGSGKRWWDWNEVALKCVLPATVLYFVSAWALLFRREFAGC